LRNSDKQDKCRLGFVAFSRAMELLCLACREPADAKTSQYLEELGFTLLPRLQGSDARETIA
jgi:DNA helicase-2/ATP-dependent DNA helicase PcrA